MTVRRRSIILLVIALMTLGTACSSGTDSGGPPSSTRPPDGVAESDDDASSQRDVEGVAADDDPNNPWVFGYSIDGPVGTQLEVVSTIFSSNGDVEHDPLERSYAISDPPIEMLYSSFIDSGTIEIEVTEGGPVTVTVIEGRLADPSDPMGAIDVNERLDTVEVVAGSKGSLSFG